MRLPSIKTISRAFGTDAADSIRRVMEDYRDNRFGCCQALDRIVPIINGFGVEHIPSGHNQKSPAIHYVNMGDTYTTTVMFVRGQFIIGNWGSIVELGNYD